MVVQVQNQHLELIEKLNFHLIVQSQSGRLTPEKAPVPENFMEKIYSELAIRKGENVHLSAVNKEYTLMRMYQYFSLPDAVYVQLFVNQDPDLSWNQKTSFHLNNMEILGVKNQRKPLNLHIEPFEHKTILIQQVNGKEFEMVGGEGACIVTKAVKKWGDTHA